MKYLCDGHREAFSNNPEQAKQAWQNIVFQARELFHTVDWEQASLVYGNAFEISELLLSSDPSQFSVDRYLRTAFEFAYCLRKDNARIDLESFIFHVKNHVDSTQHAMGIAMLIQPLQDVVNLPIHVTDFWMKSLLSLDSIDSRVLH